MASLKTPAPTTAEPEDEGGLGFLVIAALILVGAIVVLAVIIFCCKRAIYATSEEGRKKRRLAREMKERKRKQKAKEKKKAKEEEDDASDESGESEEDDAGPSQEKASKTSSATEKKKKKKKKGGSSDDESGSSESDAGKSSSKKSKEKSTVQIQESVEGKRKKGSSVAIDIPAERRSLFSSQKSAADDMDGFDDDDLLGFRRAETGFTVRGAENHVGDPLELLEKGLLLPLHAADPIAHKRASANRSTYVGRPAVRRVLGPEYEAPALPHVVWNPASCSFEHMSHEEKMATETEKRREIERQERLTAEQEKAARKEVAAPKLPPCVATAMEAIPMNQRPLSQRNNWYSRGEEIILPRRWKNVNPNEFHEMKL